MGARIWLEEKWRARLLLLALAPCLALPSLACPGRREVINC